MVALPQLFLERLIFGFEHQLYLERLISKLYHDLSLLVEDTCHHTKAQPLSQTLLLYNKYANFMYHSYD